MSESNFAIQYTRQSYSGWAFTRALGVGIGAWLAWRILKLDRVLAIVSTAAFLFSADNIATALAAYRLWKEGNPNPNRHPTHALIPFASLAGWLICRRWGQRPLLGALGLPVLPLIVNRFVTVARLGETPQDGKVKSPRRTPGSPQTETPRTPEPPARRAQHWLRTDEGLSKAFGRINDSGGRKLLGTMKGVNKDNRIGRAQKNAQAIAAMQNELLACSDPVFRQSLLGQLQQATASLERFRQPAGADNRGKPPDQLLAELVLSIRAALSKAQPQVRKVLFVEDEDSGESCGSVEAEEDAATSEIELVQGFAELWKACQAIGIDVDLPPADTGGRSDSPYKKQK